MSLLRVDHLNVVVDGQVILDDITFTLEQHEVLIILGPNGAGKSVLLKSLLGIMPYQGDVVWKTKRISYLPPQEMLIRQGLPPLTIEDFFSLKNVPRKDMVEMLEAVGLDGQIYPKKQFATLSTGLFQRVMIAWALVNNPDILLFDEPTSSIDVGGEETIYSLLHSFWKKRNLAIILVTHDLQVVWEHATNVLCLNKEVLCQGSPEKILSPEMLKKLYGVGVKVYEHRHN